MKTNDQKEVENFRLNLDGIDEKPEDCKKMSPEAGQLYLFNSKIFAESEEFIARLSYLNEKRFEKYGAQCILLDKKICNTLKNSVNKFLKKLRICQITNAGILTTESLKTVAIQTLEAFNEFMKRSFPSIEEILKRCHVKQKLTFKEDLKIDLEVKRYINCLQYHFNNFYDLKILEDTKYQEKLKKITIDLNSFYKKVLENYCELNTEVDTHFAKETFVEQHENIEKKQLPENYTPTNVESTAFHKPNVSDFTFKLNNAVENVKDDTKCLLCIALGVSFSTFLTIFFAAICLFLKRKNRKSKNNEIEEDHKLLDYQSKD
ncbi:hypothetical protein NBO_1537g0001 [Nosema bombycis CQ1]|uniref:Uncharacterized protein n=1 Tax=Nosema bombycis (strain CQ1 / CVCC 102059) TaxID=578461 RepID=R0LZC9_NOSB1|nr:hypothetical protein NBO_1537g0001 [Nosema bombycis CQ1]|eukprot:EOB11169.1 hypothetical protein NBO_1537g0001 [Nosema bombycis CQ1]